MTNNLFKCRALYGHLILHTLPVLVHHTFTNTFNQGCTHFPKI